MSDFEFLETCSHQYATKLFAKSINDKTMIACIGCLTYQEYHDGECVCVEDEDRAVVGEYVTEDTLNGFVFLSNMEKNNTEVSNGVFNKDTCFVDFHWLQDKLSMTSEMTLKNLQAVE